MANANLFQAYLQPPKSVLDYSNDLDVAESRKAALEGQRQQNALQALTLQQNTAASQAQAGERNALSRIASGWSANTTPEERVAALRNSGLPGLMNQADALEKGALDRTKIQAGAAKDTAEADAKRSETRWKLADRHAQDLARVRTPQDAVAYIDSAVQAGLLPPQMRDQEIASMQQQVQQQGLGAWLQAESQAAIPVVEKFKRDAEMQRAQLTADTQVKTTGMNNATTRRGQDIAERAALQGGSVQVDGSGNMIVVPNKAVPGSPVSASPVVGADGKPLKGKDGGGPKISAEVQRQIGGVLSFDKDLSALEEALTDFDPRGMDQFNTAKRAKIQSISKQAQLSAKEAAALGALSGPDMSLLEGILNDPTSMKGAVSGEGGIRAQISEARAGNKRRVLSLQQQYGDKAVEGLPAGLKGPAAGASAPAAADIHAQADAILRGVK